MEATELEIGKQVVRSKGDYVIGRTGPILEIDKEKDRVRVQWSKGGKSWVKIECVEPKDIPYKIIPAEYNERTGKHISRKYRRL